MTVTLYTLKGDPFTVDDEDAPLVSQFTWELNHPIQQVPVTGMPMPVLGTNISDRFSLNGLKGKLALRSLIMGRPASPTMQIFTLNGDPLCMEKSNLVWLDRSTLVHWTLPPSLPGHFYGVRQTPLGKWRVCFNSCIIGTFSSKKAAAMAYDRAARKRYGPWARLNFPEIDPPLRPGTTFPPLDPPILRATSGKPLQVDPEFLPVVSRFPWRLGAYGYWAKIGRFQIPLALLVMGRPGVSGLSWIHWIDGNIQNCTAENLLWYRAVTPPLRGVHLHRQQWLAVIQHGGKTHTVGSYATPEEAARAYDTAAIMLLGRRAELNFPPRTRSRDERGRFKPSKRFRGVDMTDAPMGSDATHSAELLSRTVMSVWGFSGRVLEAISRRFPARAATLGDLVALRPKDLVDMCGHRSRTLKDINQVLGSLGLALQSSRQDGEAGKARQG